MEVTIDFSLSGPVLKRAGVKEIFFFKKNNVNVFFPFVVNFLLFHPFEQGVQGEAADGVELVFVCPLESEK